MRGFRIWGASLRNRANTPRAKKLQELEWICHTAVKTRARRNGGTCPVKVGKPITQACHIVRKSRGMAIRFEPLAIYGGSQSANAGEHWHPAKYRDLHIQVFGRELVERLEARAKENTRWSMDDIDVLTGFWKHRLEFALVETMPPNPHEGEARSRGLIL